MYSDFIFSSARFHFILFFDNFDECCIDYWVQVHQNRIKMMSLNLSEEKREVQARIPCLSVQLPCTARDRGTFSKDDDFCLMLVESEESPPLSFARSLSRRNNPHYLC